MFAKELRGTWWKVVVGAASFLPAVMIVAVYLPPYETTGRVMERFTDGAALGQILNVYGGGGVALALLAILLGAPAVSEEVSRGTIFLLLSKPRSRVRTLLIKYTTSAAILLLASVFGHAALVAAAIVKGYPLGLLNLGGMILSTVLMWLGSLSVLGIAIACSVLLRGALICVAAAFVATYVIFYVLPSYAEDLVPYEKLEMMAPPYSWTSEALYAGEGMASLNFLSCFLVAAALLGVSLWLFSSRAY